MNLTPFVACCTFEILPAYFNVYIHASQLLVKGDKPIPPSSFLCTNQGFTAPEASTSDITMITVVCIVWL